jgi:adenylate kinase
VPRVSSTGKQLNVVLLGAPGSGKGTQAERIAPAFGVPHISTGDMLRAALQAGTELGLTAKKYMYAGELVPDDVVVGIIRERLAEPDAARGFLLDGFPRTLEQAAALDAMLAAAGRALNVVLLIDGPEEELVRRLAGRRACRDCGKGYHVIFDPPRQEGVCDVCGGQLYQRADDAEETVRNRLAVYRRQTEPLVGYYAERGVLQKVFGGGRMPDEVYGDVEKVLAEA